MWVGSIGGICKKNILLFKVRFILFTFEQNFKIYVKNRQHSYFWF